MNADLKTRITYILIYPMLYDLGISKKDLDNRERETLSWENFLNFLLWIPLLYLFYILSYNTDSVAKDHIGNERIEAEQKFN
jgi:hypothetical protein